MFKVVNNIHIRLVNIRIMLNLIMLNADYDAVTAQPVSKYCSLIRNSVYHRQFGC